MVGNICIFYNTDTKNCNCSTTCCSIVKPFGKRVSGIFNSLGVLFNLGCLDGFMQHGSSIWDPVYSFMAMQCCYLLSCLFLTWHSQDSAGTHCNPVFCWEKQCQPVHGKASVALPWCCEGKGPVRVGLCNFCSPPGSTGRSRDRLSSTCQAQNTNHSPATAAVFMCNHFIVLSVLFDIWCADTTMVLLYH